MSDLNKWIGSGRVTRDTELRRLANGTAVADVGMCSNRTYYNKEKNEKIEEPTFTDVTLWGKQAENLAQYLTKGTQLTVVGRLKLETWETDGQKRSKLKVVAEEVNLGSKPKASNGGASVNSGDGQTPF
jgi:single-strand DNA-binding protein